MEYQKIVNLLDNAHNEPSKFRTRNWVEMSDELWGMYNKNNQRYDKVKFMWLY